MRLKAIEMQGFKSFPDKTRLTFENGITVIVGPNGSGKSNITDAVRWVLGEMSTKSIRGSKMEDVIFGGSDNRRPMSYAEVTLFIDNTQGLGRLESDFSEVSVTRRYFRSGDSEYLINGQKSRLRDITELFMNTGVGKTGYSNIGQGKIAEIISQKSDERRSVFEEAAGISKFRARKNEAERKLKESENNLLRVGDMLSDLGERVGPLEKEAAAARKYLDLHEQKKEVDVSLWIFEAEQMRDVANETEKLWTAAKLSLDDVDSEIASNTERSEQLYIRASESQQSVGELTESLSHTVDEKHSIESSNKVLENDILHIEERILQAKRDLEMKRGELSDGETNSVTIVENIRNKEKAISDIENEIEAKKNQLDEAEKLCRELDEGILELDDERHFAESDLTNLKMDLSALDGSHQAGSGRKSDLENQAQTVRENVASLTDSAARTKETFDRYAEAHKAASDKVLDGRDGLDAISDKIDAVKEKLASNTVSVEAKKQRAEALKRMDDLLEGYNYSVKNVMNAASNGSISGICGPVSRLLNVGKEYSIAIETALGANIQNIVVNDENAAKSAISFLKRTGGGRATFYPLTSVKGRQLAVSPEKLSSHKGYVGMGDELCSFDKKYSEVMSYLLGGTAVFDNLDNASYTAKAFGYRLRIVTLDGQLINAGGSFTGGSVKTDSGILTRSAEISAIKDEITKLSIAGDALRSELDSMNGEYSALEDEITENEGKMSLLETLKSNSSTELEVIRTKLESEKERLSQLETELEGIGEETTKYDNRRSDICWNIRQAEKALEEAESKLEEAKTQSAEADDRRQDVSDELNKLYVTEASLSAELAALKQNSDLNAGTISALGSQISQTEELISNLEDKLVNCRTKIAEQKKKEDELSRDIDTAEAERKKLAEQNIAFEKKQAEIREKLRDLNSKRDVLFREYTKLDSKRENLTTEHDRLAEKIWEDYELTYSAAVELNYAPITAEMKPEYSKRQTELRNKLRALGSVNVGAIEEYAEVKEKYEFNKAQYDDLTQARESLNGIIDRLEREMKVRFTTAFEDINRNFKVTFKELFGGGNAEILLADPENVLESGIEINVAPPGKIINNLISLSGGEQAFVAIALIFAILNVNPTPFCIFDEIESALDEVNVIRLAEYMKRYSEKTQFVVITHRRGTMEASDMLYGITMPDRGISKVLSMNVNEVEQKIGEKYV